MAVTQGKSPLIMTEVGDTVPLPGVLAPGYGWWVHSVRFVTTENSGIFKVLDRPGGRVIFESKSMDANDADHLSLECAHYDGFYLHDSSPAGGAVYLYYK